MISIIAGTNRPNAYSLKVAKLIQELLQIQDQATCVISLEDIPQDLAHSGMYGRSNDAFTQLAETSILDAQALIIVAPEYNGSYPGILKTFLDALPARSGWKAIADMPIFLVGVASGPAGNLRGLDHLTGVLHYMSAQVYHGNMLMPGITKLITENGQWQEGAEVTRDMLEKRLANFVDFVDKVGTSN